MLILRRSSLISNSGSKGDLKLIVFRDLCRVRNWGLDFFDVVFDIGANIGAFSLLMRMLHINAKIIAVEPSNRNLDVLRTNLDHLGIVIDTRGLGDGSEMYLQYGRKRSPMSDWFSPHRKHKYSHTIETVQFWKIFEDHKCRLEDKFFVKIDCEGAERYLIGDSKSGDVLTSAEQVFMEVHFNAERNPWHGGRDLEWKDYDDWIKDTFSKTHDIDLHYFNINKGHGHYCIKKKSKE
jgi:FkbM family methyltransferase